MFYEKLPKKKVKCSLCPHDCIIAPKRWGVCGVRQNIDGTLYTHIYGIVSSIAIDPIEKKPLFHFYPGSSALSLGTFGCNMRCGHCQNWQIAHANMKDNLPPYQFIKPEALLKVALEKNCRGIAWTYNEPAIWFEYTLDGAKLFKEKGLYTVYVTNGYISLEALDTIGPYLDAFRVDIKGFTNEFYKTLAKINDFSPVLKATERAKNKWNMHIECVTNIIPTLNDDEKQLKDIATWIKNTLGEDTPWHVTRFIPFLEFSHLPPTPKETLEKARDIGLKTGLKYVYTGNITGHPGEHTYCPNCNKLLIERTGYFITANNIENSKCKFCQTKLNGLVGI
jgi:pyruvate formate lyase activating enzyme